MQAATKGGSLLITGARVYTGDRLHPWAEAIAIQSGLLLHVGSERDARSCLDANVEHLHVPGGLAVPGLNDSHTHLSYAARTLSLLNLEGILSVTETLARLGDFARNHPEREWLEGFGLPYETFASLDRPVRLLLDEAAGTFPVFLRAFDYHSAWCNTEALRRAGLERASLPGVESDGATGLATGTLREHVAMDAVASAMPPWTERQRDDALTEAMRAVNRLGVTSVQNMDGDAERLEQYARLASRGLLTVRAAHYLRFPQNDLLPSLPTLAELKAGYADPWNRAAGLKVFLDGVVETKTAWMQDPYCDGSGDTGGPVMDPELHGAVVLEADRLGIDVATHAIGDRAVHVALNHYGAARRRNPGGDTRHRIEHIEVVRPSDLDRFAPLGVTASMQPYHGNPPDAKHTIWNQRVGREREAFAFAWSSVLRHGAALAFGSDWPIVSADPRLGIRTALTRTNEQGFPIGGWQPQERLTLSQILDAYTRGAAHAERQETFKGVLRAGMAGDVTVFGRDPFALEPSAIPEAPIAATIVAGRVVHRSAPR